MPLKDALPPGEANIAPGKLSAGQRNGIEAATAGRVFRWDFQQGINQSALVVLSPVTG
jgi:hypothetical protein